VLQRTLLSRPNLERVIARTDLDQRVHDVASREQLIESLGKSIKITLQTRQLFRIEYSDRDPRIAFSVVQTVVNQFLEAAASNDRQQMQQARAFMNQQIAAYEAQLRQAETRRAEFMARYVDILPSAQYGGSSRLEASRQRLAEVRGQLQDATLRRDSLRQQLEQTPQTLAEARAAAAGGNPQLAAAEQQLRDLLLRYTDQHPAVVQQRNLIAALRAGGGSGAAQASPPAARGGQGAAPAADTPPPRRPGRGDRLARAAGA
jgi:polysaccharide chain length determinant protein (PEP-CTERM system associated)